MDVNIKNLDGWAISLEAFQWIRENIKEGSTILELGSGTGTFELTKLYKVYSVEHLEKWVGLCKDTNYIYSPLVNGWYNREILKEKLPKKYDLLLVDGPIKQDRLNFFKNSDLFNKNIPILFDDTQRENLYQLVEEFSKKEGKEILNFDSKDKKFSVLI